jgi:Zn-dependent peptidase ImmA (M78 family)
VNSSVTLERIDIDDVATDPMRIAAEIHRQLGDISGPVPVYDIARALDIEEIETKPLQNFEGMLLTKPERDFGTVLLNSLASPQRRNYSLAHELGHFLCGWHITTENAGFRCSQRDMASPSGSGRHVNQEREANQFAIELLAPPRLVKPYLRRFPDLEDVLALHQALDISKAAAARRYVELHKERQAVIFARNNSFNYTIRGSEFPWIDLADGDPLPTLPRVPQDARTSEMVEMDPQDWHIRGATVELAVQVLSQENGHAIVLLHVADVDDEA